MRYAIPFCGLLLAATSCFSQPGWKMVPGRISTQWSADVHADAPHPEYPRPQLVRDRWINLNGLWDYAILPATAGTPARFDGQLLVPFAVESALSGVGKSVGKDSALWYRRSIELTAPSKGGHWILHFGAVDWQCDVFVNGTKMGSHRGGYDPFSVDITTVVKKGKKQEIVLRVWDPSDDGPQPRGKQVKKPEGIWYTSVTGVWQTVWLEQVPVAYVTATRQTPDVDQERVRVSVEVANSVAGDEMLITAWRGSEVVAKNKAAVGTDMFLAIPSPELWSPDHPFLYHLTVTLLRSGKKIDEVRSYFAMRKISIGKDGQGIQRMLLNNHFVFQYGPLDQGWWPDGLYTAPTDEALAFDIAQVKAMGFNMIRKHVKVEPASWYHHCDSLGVLVWQDMPSGDMGGNTWDMRPGQVSGHLTDKERSPESEAIFRTEWNHIMDALYNFPSIVVWVPFNEAWGQFKTKEITEWTVAHDPSRLVNPASGGNFLMSAGQVFDIHHYPDPQMPTPELFGGQQALVLGEFGGLGLPVEGHTWQQKNNWGYQSFHHAAELEQRYRSLIGDLRPLVRMGLSAAIYTQITDVEVEVNGLMTYDRKQTKIPVTDLAAIHQQLYAAADSARARSER